MEGKLPYHKLGLSAIGILLAILFFVMPSYAQLTRGAISGTIHDTAGAVIAGATVKITNVDTNLSRTATTNNEGFYRFAAVEPGIYSIAVEKTGFTVTKLREALVRTAQEVTFDATLTAGGTSETVDVSAQAEGIALNKSNPTIGLTLTGRQSVDLPLTGVGTNGDRNINNLALLSPNAFRAPGSTQISANGQRARNNNFTIDGSDNNDISVTLPSAPIIPESVAEFQVQTNAYNAEFGRNSGAQINVITKSGTNRYHGDIWEYYRGSALNSLSNIEKGFGQTEPSRFNRNQLGFDVGGPVIKDRTFFFGAFQADRTRNNGLVGLAGQAIRIPTPAGFAALQRAALRPATATLPQQTLASRQAALDGISFLNDIYKRNLTFTSVNQSVSVNGTAIETGQTFVPISQPNDTWNWLVRGDHKIREGDNFTARYAYNKPSDVNTSSNIGFGSLFSGNVNLLDQNLALSETHVFTPTILNEFRFSYIRRNFQFPENDPLTPSSTILGGFFTIGGNSNFPQGRIQNSFQWSDTISWQKDKHALKFGLDVRRIRLLNFAAFDSKGTYTFNNLQDYMNNSAFSFVQALQTATFDARQTQQFYFAQDTFHVTPSLTLNLGVRYEYAKLPFGGFGATDSQSLAALVPGPVKKDRNNLAPVLGFSYSPRVEKGFLGKAVGDGKTVFRGGYRIAYDLLFYNILTVNGSNFPRLIVSRLDAPATTDIFPNLVTGGPTQFNPLATYVNTPEDARTPYSQIYSFSIQREAYRDFVIEFGYTGSHSLNQVNQLQANPAILTPAQIADVRAGRTIPSAQQRRLNPQFGQRVLIATEAQGGYNAGFVSVNKRMSRGVEFGFAYTYSKNISNNDESLGVGAITTGSPQVPQDYFNYKAEKSPSAFDRTHRVVAHYLYEVPALKANWAQKPVLKQVFNGWQLSGVTAIQSGQPFTIVTGVDTNGNGTPTGDRPMYNPSGAFTVDPYTGNLRTFTTSKVDGRFLTPLAANGSVLANGLGNGNLGKNTLRAPGFANTDFSLGKRFKILESHTLVLRVDLLNAFNQDNFGIPVNSLNSPSFGLNTNNWGNRSLTLGAKYTF